jgi:hypothetical protein
VSELRKWLFDKTGVEGAEGKLAVDVLEFIDRQRDEYGRPNDERRHPDVASGKSWPIASNDGGEY